MASGETPAATARRGPLDGIRVVDFGHQIAGPAVGMLLADAGADVVKVRRPSSTRWRSPLTAILDRGKSIVELDLRDDEGRRSASDLLADADVLIENFRPGVMDRLGLGPAQVSAANPRVVYLSLPGFASGDADLAGVPAWEAIIGAAVGQLSDMGLNRVLMGVEPSYSPLPLASAYGAVLGAMAVVLALRARERHGRGDVVEVPLATALSEGLAHNSIQVEDVPRRYRSLREREIERRKSAGEPFDEPYAGLQRYFDPFYKSYRCSDGRLLYLVCVGHRAHVERALKATGLWDEVVEAGFPRDDPWTSSDTWEGEGSTSLWAYPIEEPWASWLSERLAAVFATKPSFEWEALLDDSCVPAAAQRTTQEWLSSAHARGSGLIVEVEDPDHGAIAQPGRFVWGLDGAPASTPSTTEAAPDGTADATPASPNAGMWLEDVRILDLANVIAGPTASSTLARFGAEVIRVDPPRPSYDPADSLLFGLHANAGKRSALVDLSSSEGKRLLARLLERSDVLTTNFMPGQQTRLGIDEETVAAANPHLVWLQLDAWGGADGAGPRGACPGYDDTVQAGTGIMARFGGSIETPEEHAHAGTVDVLGGFLGAYAIALGLLQRERGGAVSSPAQVRTSLAAAAQLIQLPFMYDCPARAPFDEPQGRHVKGAHELYRAYEAADGWLFLACPRERVADLAAVPGLEDIGAVDRSELVDYLSARLARHPRDHWRAAFAAVDVAALPISSMASRRERHRVRLETGADPVIPESTFAYAEYPSHPSGRTVTLVAPTAVRPRGARARTPSPTPKYGEHTVEVLREAGFDGDEIDLMLARGLVAERWSDEYLPQ